jgi:hypothetical protein
VGNEKDFFIWTTFHQLDKPVDLGLESLMRIRRRIERTEVRNSLRKGIKYNAAVSKEDSAWAMKIDQRSATGIAICRCVARSQHLCPFLTEQFNEQFLIRFASGFSTGKTIREVRDSMILL